MAVDVNIHHTLDATNFESVFNAFTEKMNSIVNNLNVAPPSKEGVSKENIASQQKSTSPEFNNFRDLTNDTLRGFKEFNVTSLMNRQLVGQIRTGATKMALVDDPKANEIIKALNNNVAQYKKSEITNEELNERLRDLKNEIPAGKSSLPAEKDNFNRNLIRSIFAVELAGGLARVGGLFAAQGGIAGSASQSLNTGILNSGNFMNDYQSRMLMNQQEIKNTIAGSGAVSLGMGIGGLVGGPIGAGVGGVIGAGVGSIYSYFGNKETQEQIASNKFMLQSDERAWRIRSQLGLGSTGSFRGQQLGINLNNRYYNAGMPWEQAEMLNNPQLAPFAAGYADYALSANRQAFRQDKNAPLNAAYSQTAAGLLGYGQENMGQFVNLVTTAATVSNQSIKTTLDQLLDINKRYGGDTAKNTALTVQLMQTSNIGGNFDKNLEMISRYQYNPAALQNVMNATRTSPMNKWIASQFGNLLGLSSEEINSGQLSGKHLNEYRRAQSSPTGNPNPRFLLYDMFAQLRGVDLNVNPYGVMNKVAMGQGTPIEDAMKQLPASMRAMTDTVIDSLQNLKVGQQTVYAESVTIEGNAGNNVPGVSDYTNSKKVMEAQKKRNSSSGSGTKTGHLSTGDIEAQRQQALQAINMSRGTNYSKNDIPTR